jgi:GTP cyclohydrolase I
MDNNNKFKKKYEWVGDISEYNEPTPNKFSKKYVEPDREYDEGLKVDQDYINTLPDLQNGPSSLIQGEPVEIQQVGIHNFKLPLRFKRKSGGTIELETSVTGTVSLEAHKKGINMSRLMREFYKFRDETFSIDKLEDVLEIYREKLKSFEAKIMLKFSYPILQKSLRSGNEGFQYYKVTLEADVNKQGEFRKIMHFDFVYSSSCPCSYELSENARKYRNKATVSHSQRSVARISVEFNNMLWVEDLQEMCLKALATETQVIVKREDEQAFAELNGSNLKFVEDSARLLYKELINNKNVLDFRIIASHQESLHSHDAISTIVPPNSKFSLEVSHEIFSSLIHIS